MFIQMNVCQHARVLSLCRKIYEYMHELNFLCYGRQVFLKFGNTPLEGGAVIVIFVPLFDYCTIGKSMKLYIKWKQISHCFFYYDQQVLLVFRNIPPEGGAVIAIFVFS